MDRPHRAITPTALNQLRLLKSQKHRAWLGCGLIRAGLAD
jgi:hypothetical protein